MRRTDRRWRADARVRIAVITLGLADRAPTAAEWTSTPLDAARDVLAAG